MALCSLFYYSKPGGPGHDECELTESTQYTSSSFFSVSVSVFRASQSVFFLFFKRVFSLVFHFHKCSQPNINQACFSLCPLHKTKSRLLCGTQCLLIPPVDSGVPPPQDYMSPNHRRKKCKNSSCECLGKRLKDQETCLEKLWSVWHLCMEDDDDRWEDKVDYMVAGGKYMVYDGLSIWV